MKVSEGLLNDVIMGSRFSAGTKKFYLKDRKESTLVQPKIMNFGFQ